MTDQTVPLFGLNASSPVSWASVMRIWWLMTWRASVGSIATGMTIGIVVTIAGISLGWPPLVRNVLIFGACSIVALVWHIFAVRIALEKIYADLRLTFAREL